MCTCCPLAPVVIHRRGVMCTCCPLLVEGASEHACGFDLVQEAVGALVQEFAGGGGQPPVRGALAVQPEYEPPASSAQPAADRAYHALSRITTLHPSSYVEARTIGEHYRDGIPVIMNLTELDDADARRLVDFAAGLVFAMRGAMDKITNKVFLISPPNVDVTAEERRRLAEGGFIGRG